MIRKIFIGIGIIIGVLFLCMSMLVGVVSSTNKSKASNEEILQSNQQTIFQKLKIIQTVESYCIQRVLPLMSL